MSTEEIKIVENILEGFLNPAKEIRDQAQMKFSELSQNFPALCFCLSKLVSESQNVKNKTFACVALRKLLEIKGNEIGNKKWENMDSNIKEEIKSNLINALVINTEPSLNNKICDTICGISSCVYESDEKWEQLIHYVITNFSMELTPQTMSATENSLSILSQIYFVCNEEMQKHSELFINAFKKYFTTDNLNLKTRTVSCISEIFASCEKKQLKVYRQFSMNILETILKCAENVKEESNLLTNLDVLAAMCQEYPIMFKKHFGDIFILMGKLIEKKDDIADNIRELAFEVILSLATKYPKLIKENEKMKILLELIFKYALEMDDEVPAEWLNPKSDSLINEDVIPEEKLHSSLLLIERLLENGDNQKQVLGLIADIVFMFIKNESHWRYKYIGFMVVSQICESIDDIKNICHIFPEIYANLNNAHPKIRFACLECINSFSEQFSPIFQNENYIHVIGNCLSLFKDPSLRIRMEACFCLESFFESVNDQVAMEYCEKILNEIFAIFLQEEVQVNLIDSLVNLTCEIVKALDDKFKPYSDKCMEIFCEFLFKIYKMKVKSSLFGPLLVVISTIGPISKESFEKYLPSLIEISVDIQNNVSSFEDPVLKSLGVAWEAMIPLVNEKSPNAIPSIIESSLKLITKTPTISVSSNPDTKFDLGDLLSEEVKKESDEGEKMNINTAETNELADSIELINVFIEGFDQNYLPYVEFTEQTIMPLNNYQINNTVRGTSITVLDTLTTIISKYSSVENFHAKVKQYISRIFEVLEKEEDDDNVSIMLETLQNIFETAKLFLTTPEINSMFAKFIDIFNKIEKSRTELVKHKETQEEALNKEKLSNLKEDDSDNEFEDDEDDLNMLEYDIDNLENILTGFSDVMGTIFKHHKNLCLEVVNNLIVEYLPRYFKDESSNFEKKLGFFILDDMIEYLGQELLYNFWNDIFQILIKHSNTKLCSTRQAVIYGIGEFAKFTKVDYQIYAQTSIEALINAYNVPRLESDEKEAYNAARDNCTASIGKVIKYQGEKIDLKGTIEKWVHFLPIEEDKSEGKEQYELLCEIILKRSELIVGDNYKNLPQIIRVLSKAYKTSFSETSIDDNINIIMKNFKENSSLHVYVQEAIKISEDKVANKIKDFFK